ncbi:MAG: hypothetical protein IMZ52_02745 [Actinobacteria bacterium]|nr:hypothetical protein [Actinomycetota bacterium]MBE3114835.1 hypothetical protein [Actinomycetota bacterium]
METIGILIDRLIIAEIKINDGYKEGNENLRDELIKEIDRRADTVYRKGG